MADAVGPRGYDEERAELIRQEHAAGASTRDLKEKYQMSIHTVQRMINRTHAYGPRPVREIDDA